MKRPRAESFASVPLNPSLPGAQCGDANSFPDVGEEDDLQAALEQEMDNMQTPES